MDESGIRIGCPKGEKIIVPIDVKELYSASPENRKSVTLIETISADGKKPIPPFIIAPGAKIMENWITAELVGEERIACTPTGYTNNDLALQYLDHLVQHSGAGPEKGWKILLLNGHESHCTDEFQIKAQSNHILPFYFPSHLTHALQPLDVGIFRPWKHFHSLAIQSALRSLDFEYTMTSFMRDLTSIREQTMKYHTIRNAFQESGIWPPSAKQGIKKMRVYQKKNPIDTQEDDELELPKLPPQYALDIYTTAATVREFADRDPTQFSDPSIKRFRRTMKDVNVQLNKGILSDIKLKADQVKEKAELKRRSTSRRSIQKGGAATSINKLREKKEIRDYAERTEKLRLARKRLQQAVNRAKKDLQAKGIQARKEERSRLARIQSYQIQNIVPHPLDLIPIREPDKSPTILEQLRMTEDFYPELQQVVRELEAQLELEVGESIAIDDDDVVIKVGNSQQMDNTQVYRGSSPTHPRWQDTSDSESITSDVDSIRENSDFVYLV
jgi:hypothetical protein